MKHSDEGWRTVNTKPMADRQLDQLIGLAHPAIDRERFAKASENGRGLQAEEVREVRIATR